MSTIGPALPLPLHAIPITPNEIEVINAHGPFNHSVWRGRGITVSHEEGLAGRVEFLSKTVRAAILERYSFEQLSGLSIADIGCYDGWLLESLSDLPFKSMVGIEPRADNIVRGRRVRDILGLSSRVHYLLGDVETLDESLQYDIVLCMGVLHHLESINSGLRKLRSVCGQFLIVESLCLPSEHLTQELKRDVELKDMVYRFKPDIFGITAQKYEGYYYPGSGLRFSVVNVPTIESLKMHMDALAFTSISVLADWSDYRQALARNHRPIHAVCVSAVVGKDPNGSDDINEHAWIEQYEGKMARAILPLDIIGPLHNVFCNGGLANTLPATCKELCRIIQNAPNVSVNGGECNLLDFDNPIEREIVLAFAHCPEDKIRLEFAKALIADGKLAAAIDELRKITCRVSADWRACYRAFYFLAVAYTMQGNQTEALRYQKACLTCNPRFPKALFEIELNHRWPIIN